MSYPDTYPGTYGDPPQPLLPLLPTLIVEAGLTPDAPAGQASTVLRLDDTTYGLLDTGTLGSSITWTDISSYVIGFSVSRPSTRLAGPLWNYQAGTCSITLDNSDGRFEPDNLDGPYVAAGVTQLTPMVPVRITAVFGSITYSLFSGFADGWFPAQVTYEGGYAETTVNASDAFKVLTGITLPETGTVGAGVTTGARITDILSRASWYGTGDRQQIAAGAITVQGTTLGTDALTLMQIAADTEIGQLYCSGAGAVVFRGRQQTLTDTRSSVVQAVFGDLPGTVQTAGQELPYAAVARATDDTTLVNNVQATRTSGALQEVQDAASLTRYLFPRSYARTDLIMTDDGTAAAWADWVLYIAKDASDRFDNLQIDPLAQPLELWPQVLGREIGDRVQVWHRPASVTTPISKDNFITGITHGWDSVASTWLTTWTLQDAAKYATGQLTLNNAALGRLDTNSLS